ncbi:hypothetical protein B0J13DRAFT_624639 [Dactylonectria estremocensis]|uniref:Uncharacterized protein n=1 Tax=Dactylonectria estremocensis TaxID=1079267 RepID=A0A9P9ELT9_9HYPO|nr:hypothetical protein B0J13DRAFT_624639 [Dactylonectria estremocensis]
MWHENAIAVFLETMEFFCEASKSSEGALDNLQLAAADCEKTLTQISEILMNNIYRLLSPANRNNEVSQTMLLLEDIGVQQQLPIESESGSMLGHEALIRITDNDKTSGGFRSFGIKDFSTPVIFQWKR